MPCGDSGGHEYEFTELRIQLRDAKRAACELYRLLVNVEEFSGWPQVSKETLTWIRRHEKEDRERIARELRQKREERRREAVLNKLTAAERRILRVR